MTEDKAEEIKTSTMTTYHDAVKTLKSFPSATIFRNASAKPVLSTFVNSSRCADNCDVY